MRPVGDEVLIRINAPFADFGTGGIVGSTAWRGMRLPLIWKRHQKRKSLRCLETAEPAAVSIR
jgi:hypothetical protein